jgi:hypothetical protein
MTSREAFLFFSVHNCKSEILEQDDVVDVREPEDPLITFVGWSRRRPYQAIPRSDKNSTNTRVPRFLQHLLDVVTLIHMAARRSRHRINMATQSHTRMRYLGTRALPMPANERHQ